MSRKEKEEEMDAIHAILSRRSIRRYTAQPVPEGMTNELLEAAMSAPSAGNQQPWHFVIITDRKILDEIPKYHRWSQMLKEASAAILVCGDLKSEKYKGFWVQDCSAATQNILLAAHAKGLGAVWLGIYPDEARVVPTRKLLGLPDHIVPLSLVSIGHPAEQKPPADRYDSSKVHHNQW
jgi:nitroreductase